VVRAAASEQSGTAELISDQPGSPIASLHPRRDSYFQGSPATRREQVPVTTVDRLMEEYGLTTIDFMKIDTEGHDLAALVGAEQALRAHAVRALSFEFGSGQINSRTFFHDFWDLLHPIGYRLSRVCPGGRSIAVDAYYEDLEHFRGVSNYLAFAPGVGRPG
jgi:hypothetical protein